MVYNWLKTAQTCQLCDEPCEPHASVCGPCEAELPWLRGRCSVCALPLPTHDLLCGHCLRRPPAFDHVAVPWRFAFPIDSLINRFKHQARWPLGRLLAGQLGRHLEHAYSEGLPRPDVLLPVPLATRRLRHRGFNQARMLADWLAGELALTVDDSLLQRVIDTPAQQQLDAVTRLRNLRGAFALADGRAVAGRHFALVDDVLTTGATAQALARLLKGAGAARVDVYCLARTPKPGE